MEVAQLDQLAALRTVVGYLGEREQFGWWQSSFFGPGSQAFLTPVFARTQLLAQYNGVTRAATLIHDERIGVGNVYHLFRLLEDIEQSLHRVLHDQRLVRDIAALLTSKDVAIGFLSRLAGTELLESVGPVRVGNIGDQRDPEHWRVVAGHYLGAFTAGSTSYPYFADRA